MDGPRQTFLIRLTSWGKWDGMLRVHGGLTGIDGQMYVPGTPAHKRLLQAMVGDGRSLYDFLVRAGYDTHVLFWRGDGTKGLRYDKAFVLDANGEKVKIGDKKFWKGVAEGRPVIAGREISQVVVEEINKYPEVEREGLKYELGLKGEVVKKQMSMAVEQEY